MVLIFTWNFFSHTPLQKCIMLVIFYIQKIHEKIILIIIVIVYVQRERARDEKIETICKRFRRDLMLARKKSPGRVEIAKCTRIK